ncbi:unnamed protein product [Cylindrotheca closterium]|uniref:CSC1/OSCA1-like cytosolic domain-containing protein n=1 Tax=Cylindrotheca closterium TaxID=2856 RepID=A0AAD2FVZ2_9STRA|nr:unnamed protein product [Cylindrotheca closterium]
MVEEGVVEAPQPKREPAKRKPPMTGRMDSRIASGGRHSNRISGITLTKEEQDAILEDLKRKDDATGKKTLSRIAVEKYFSTYNWYWPRRNEKGAPQLDKAWVHYEHNILPRHLTGENDTEYVYRMAERGEHQVQTELYPTLTLPQSALIEWGSGMDLYFISIWFFAIIMLIAGCINILSIDYFGSTAYNGDTASNISTFLRASAVCTNREWVVCSTCDPSGWNSTPNNAPDRFATAMAPDGSVTNLVLKNNCVFEQFRLGWPNLLTLGFVMIATAVFSLYIRAREVRFDEDKVTTADYSVCVLNPPPDAKNPDEWRNFFEKFAQGESGQVTCVTVALDNEALINVLANRRVYFNYLRMKLPNDVDYDDDQAVLQAIDKHREMVKDLPVGFIGKIVDCVAPIFKLFGMMLNAEELYEQITKMGDKAKELQEKEYHATKVFVTFETEEGQRTALTALNAGEVDLAANRLGAVPPDCHFRGELLLSVAEPAEPSAIRYLELSSTRFSRMLRRSITITITCGLIAFASWSIFRVREEIGPFYSGNLTTILNSSMPAVLKLLLMLEKHPDEGSYQRSVYLKLTLFRWILSGLLTSFITPFTHTLGDDSSDMIPTISALLISESWLSPLMRISDYTSNLKKHVLAPRARSQEEMNSWFTGSWFQLGERYTDFTKIIFVVFFYSAVFPSGFFFGFFILLTQYYMDKFSLVRLWQPTPRLGADLANFSRRFFFSITVVAFAVVSSFTWAQYPYDKLCEPLDSSTATVGVYTNVERLDGEKVKIWIGDLEPEIDELEVVDETDYVSCGQNFRAWAGLPMPATPRVQSGQAGWFASFDEDDLTWMSDQQVTFTRIYGWAAIVILIGSIISLFAGSIYKLLLSLFRGVYEPEGAAQEIDFSSNVEIFGYVPEILRAGQTLPFLCCDVDDYDEKMISWVDPNNSYDYYNLIFDVPHKSLRRTEFANDEDISFDSKDMFGFHRSRYPNNERKELDYAASIYSLVKHYPTKWQLEIAKQDGILFDD